MPAAPAVRERPALACAAVLVALVVVAYLPTFLAGFVWDDDDYVTKNEALRSLGGLARLWLEPGVTPQYYPVTFTSLWIDYHLWGLSAAGYHLTNMLLHAANAVLVWRLLDRLAVPDALIAAVLFAVHPVHVESVAWVTERKNVLSGVFYLAAALVFVTRVAGIPPGDARRRGAYLAVVVLFVLALLSKSVTATLPVAIAIVLWWRDGRVRRSDLLLLVPLLALGVAAGLLTALMERHRVGAVGPYWNQTFAERCLIAGRALWFYVGKLLWPYPVTFNYERWTIDARDVLQWVWPIAALAVGAGAWLARARIGRGAVAALAFFAVSLSPGLGFVNVYPMRYSFVADHFQYLASLGVLTLVGAAVVGVVGPRARLVVAPVVVVLALSTAWQCFAYRDAESLWVDTLVKNPRSVLALQNMGTLAYGHGEHYDHRPSFEIALLDYQRARDVEPEQPDIWNSIGVVQARLGRRDEAITAFETALRFDPRHAEAARNLGSVLAAVGRRDEAIAAYERAVASAPSMVEAREDLAVLLARAGRPAEAEAQLRAAIATSPGSVRAHMQLGAVLGGQGRFGESVAVYQEAVRLAPRSVDAYAALADGQAKAGDFDQAIAAAERARVLARDEGRGPTVAEIDRRIAGYRDGRLAQPPAE